MPIADPKLSTIMASCVILSTLVVLTIVSPREEDAILLIGNEYPASMLKYPANMGMDTELSYSLMPTSDYERLELRFSCLYEKDLGVNLSSPVDLEEYPLITTLKEAIEPIGGEPHVMDVTTELGDQIYDARVVDFSRYLSVFNSPSMISTLPVVFVILRDDGEVRYFEGSPGFFLDGDENLDYLSISRNGNKTEYFREDEMIRETPEISEAPQDGVLVFDDVRADERFSVTFSVDIAGDALRHIVDWTYQDHFAVLVQGYADGKLELVLVNVMSRGLGDEA